MAVEADNVPAAQPSIVRQAFKRYGEVTMNYMNVT